MWKQLTSQFGIENEVRSQGRERKKGLDIEMDDPIVDKLDVLEWREGKAYIECPWSTEHSSDTGAGQCCYFPAGTRGYKRGNFKCLHASCAGRSSGDFKVALGLFDEVSRSGDLVPTSGPLTGVKYDDNGNIPATAGSVAAALRRPDLTGVYLAFDVFLDAIVARTPTDPAWHKFTDAEYFWLRVNLETKLRFRAVNHELVQKGVQAQAGQNIIDSAVKYVEGLEWDGTSRVEQFLTRFYGVDDTPYHRAVSRYWWTALAGRALNPGVQADMVPVLVGPQGARKSRSVAALVPWAELCTEITLSDRNADLARQMRGRLVAELPELSGLKTRDLEGIKAFITKANEDWVPKYQEFSTVYKRRTFFVGTTNEEEFLADPTGERRWLPVRVGRIDVESIQAECDQLWAEGAYLYNNAGGVDFADAEQLAKAQHERHMVRDVWEEPIKAWLQKPDKLGEACPQDAEYVVISQVLQDALFVTIDRQDKRMKDRVGKILRGLGYEKKDGRRKWAIRWVWVKALTPKPSNEDVEVEVQ